MTRQNGGLGARFVLSLLAFAAWEGLTGCGTSAVKCDIQCPSGMQVDTSDSSGCTCVTLDGGQADVTCDDFNKCGASVSVNALLCPGRLSDSKCGSAFLPVLRCEIATCQVDGSTDPDGGDPCASEEDGWHSCVFGAADDSGAANP